MVHINIFWLFVFNSSHTLDIVFDIKSLLWVMSRLSFTKHRSLFLLLPGLFRGKKVLNPSILKGFFSSKSNKSTSETPMISILCSCIVYFSTSSFLISPLSIFKLATLRYFDVSDLLSLRTHP